MWEDNRRKTVRRNILLALLILILIVCLVVAMKYVRRETEEHDSQLSAIQVQQQQEQSEARQESVAEIQNEYEKDMQTVAEYLPGIVCWGDSVTLGSSGVSYPYVLQKYIDTYFCDIYDFRSTIENAYEFSRLKWDSYKVSVPVVNMGAGPEDTSTILGRSGAVPYVTGEDFTIPADCEPVPIRFVSQNGRIVAPLTGGNAGVNNVSICGIEGTLSIDSDTYNMYGSTSYTFTRTEPGESCDVPAGTEITTAAADEYRDYIHVVWIGTFGGFDGNPDILVQQTKDLLARQTKNSERYIVLGIYSVNRYVTFGYQLDAIDTAMMQAFGNRYINVRKYLCGDGMSDAGLTKTAQDNQAVANNAVPPSFLTASSSNELNGSAQKLIGKLVFNRMESLGYFDEVYAELNITETTKQILKDDPSYFTNQIKYSIK